MRQGRDRRKPYRQLGFYFTDVLLRDPLKDRKHRLSPPHQPPIPIIDGGPLLGH